MHTSQSRVSILLHRVLDNKSFDVTEFDSEISSMVDGMGLVPACGKDEIPGKDLVLVIWFLRCTQREVIRDLAVLVRDTLGAKSEVKVLGKPVPGVANFYVPDVRRIQSELGVEIKHTLAEAIRESV